MTTIVGRKIIVESCAKMNQASPKGIFYLVSTPIGHLKDITYRAVEILKEVEWILAEDTRHSAILLNHYGIVTPTKSLHQHNEAERLAWIIERLSHGDHLALISDAGTPLISDPGGVIVPELLRAGFLVKPVPGCSALITALSCAGLSSEAFCFLGFLPAKSSARLTMLEHYQYETKTLIFYEAPHRLLETLYALKKVWGGERSVVVARELTKTFEQFQRGSLAEVCDYFEQHQDQVRGEIVLLLAGAPERELSLIEAERVLKILLKKLPVKQAASVAADITGLRKNILYALALRLGGESELLVDEI